MELEMKIIKSHQAKITICCQTPLVTPIALKICTVGFFNMLNPNLQSDLFSDHSSNTSFKVLKLFWVVVSGASYQPPAGTTNTHPKQFEHLN